MQKGIKYHHTGIPVSTPRKNEVYIPHLKIYVEGYETSPYGIEWMRFDPDCELPELVKTVPHVAFEVDDLDEAIKGKEILIAPNSPADGIRVAFIIDNDAPVEFLEIEKK